MNTHHWNQVHGSGNIITLTAMYTNIPLPLATSAGIPPVVSGTNSYGEALKTLIVTTEELTKW